MLNVTILACLLILTGCLGLFDDDDVIDDADADDGSTTIMNAYPPVQHYNAIGNGTLTVPAGSTMEVLEIWTGIRGVNRPVNQEYLEMLSKGSIPAHMNCATMQYNITALTLGWLPSDGGACTYTFTDIQTTVYADPAGDANADPYFLDAPFSIIYRVWS